MKVTQGESVAYWLSAGRIGQDLLKYDQCKLGKKITKMTLNKTIEEGSNKAESAALWLSASHKGREILWHDNCKLGMQISKDTLNLTIKVGPSKGYSVAFYLIDSQKGREILTYKNYSLGSQISAETLNHIIGQGSKKGCSAAGLLARTESGRALLEYNEYALGKLIIDRRKWAPNFSGGPRYFEDPETLRQFMLRFPDRRREIKSEARSHVERILTYLRLAATCRALNTKMRGIKSAYVQSERSAGEEIEMNLNSLDSREQEAFVSLSGLCLFTESSSVSSSLFNPRSIYKTVKLATVGIFFGLKL